MEYINAYIAKIPMKIEDAILYLEDELLGEDREYFGNALKIAIDVLYEVKAYEKSIEIEFPDDFVFPEKFDYGEYDQRQSLSNAKSFLKILGNKTVGNNEKILRCFSEKEGEEE